MKNQILSLIGCISLIVGLEASCVPATPVTLTLGTSSPQPLSSSTPYGLGTGIYTSSVSPQERFFELLHTNGGCQLPCWWGINPGETSWTESEQLLAELDVQVYSITVGNIIIHKAVGFEALEPDTSQEILFHEQNGLTIIMDVKVSGNAGVISEFQSAWQMYSPQNFVLNYGTPSQVWIRSISTSPSPQVGYDLWLVYRHLGVQVIYSGRTKYQSVYHICPQFDGEDGIFDMRLILQAPNSERIIEGGPIVDSYTFSWEDVTNSNLEEFVNLFSRKGETCFDAPKDVWPSP